MYKLIFLAILILGVACSKDDTSNFLWDKSFGTGIAYDTGVAADSSYLVAGKSDNLPLFIKTGKGSSPEIKYSPGYNGIYTSILETEESYLLGGSSGGGIVLAAIDYNGTELWDTIIYVSPEIMVTNICHYTDDTYVAIASDHPDSLNSYGFVVLYFNIDGDILELNEPDPGYKISVTGVTTMETGEIYVSITKNSGGEKSKASVARITPEGIIIWETELSNNTNYGAGTLGVLKDNGNLYVTGRTELSVNDGVRTWSFAASLTGSGVVTWKKYLEKSNSGTALAFDSGMNLAVLNMNCFIQNFISLPDGETVEMLRVLDACDSYDTKRLGMSLSFDKEDNCFMAGSNSGKFYYALRSGGSK